MRALIFFLDRPFHSMYSGCFIFVSSIGRFKDDPSTNIHSHMIVLVCVRMLCGILFRYIDFFVDF